MKINYYNHELNFVITCFWHICPKPRDVAPPKLQVHNFIYRLIKLSKLQVSSFGGFGVFVNLAFKKLFLDRSIGGSAVATGGPGGPRPSNDCLCPPFQFTQNTFLEHHVRTRQQAIIEKRIITLKDNSRLKFFDSLQNCWPPTTVRKCDAIILFINKPLRMCRGIGMYTHVSL